MRRLVFRHNPCLACGACCAAFRVSFYWREADDAPEGTVPLALTEDIGGMRRCMRGTNQSPPRCVALEGSVGTGVRCSIYPRRPSTCREFGPRRVGGYWIVPPDDAAQCNRARARHGLPPLEPAHRSRRRSTPLLHPCRRVFRRSA